MTQLSLRMHCLTYRLMTVAVSSVLCTACALGGSVTTPSPSVSSSGEPSPSPVLRTTVTGEGATVTSSSASCSVTQPPDPPLTPPQSITTKAQRWYGNDAVWIVLPANGTMSSSKFGWWRIVPGQLTVEGRRLDAPAPPLESSVPSGYGDIGFQASGIIFPTTGCWEVIGKVADTELRFVVSVIPPPQ